MTLQQLADYCAALLEEGHNPEAQVLLATQQSYPFENWTNGLCTRGEITEIKKHLQEEDDEFEDEDLQHWQRADDVLICEGRQLGYGTRTAWDAAETRR